MTRPWATARLLIAALLVAVPAVRADDDPRKLPHPTEFTIEVKLTDDSVVKKSTIDSAVSPHWTARATRVTSSR